MWKAERICRLLLLLLLLQLLMLLRLLRLLLVVRRALHRGTGASLCSRGCWGGER